MIVSDLKDVDLFSEVTGEQMDRDINGEVIELKEGEVLFHEGDKAKFFYIVLDGTLELYRMIKGQKLPIYNYTRGMSGGEISLLSGSPYSANGVAVTDMKIFRMDEKDFWYMMGNCETVRKKVLANMAQRALNLQRLSFQREKLISLGTMAAGLAHELNNPASAAKRTAENLSKTLHEFDVHSSEILKWYIFKDEVNKDGYPFQPIEDLLQVEGLDIDPIEKSDLEDQLADWMEEQGLEDAWDNASVLVSVGYTKEDLKNFTDLLVPDQVVNFLNWLPKDVEMRRLSNELIKSTTRISELVNSMRSYSYMDQTLEKKKINLHEGIENTLVILNHKLKRKNISLKKQFNNSIPLITAYGSELNQVWTNLIDNAIDAVANKGTITISTRRDENDRSTVSVEIIDNGKGIPKDIQDKMFDPFFTTKAPGEGSGLGLEISHRIVVNQHKGIIKIESKPGFTKFTVCLSIDL